MGSSLTDIVLNEYETFLGLSLVYANKYYDTYIDSSFVWYSYGMRLNEIRALIDEINAHLGIPPLPDCQEDL